MFKNLNESGVSALHAHTHTFADNISLFAHSVRRFVLIVVLMFFSVLNTKAQNLCGTEDMTDAEIEQFFQEIGFDPSSTYATVSGGLTTGVDIPLHLYIIFDGEGNPPGFIDLDAEYFERQLPEINSYYTGTGFNFYICNVTKIYDSYLYDPPYEDNPNLIGQTGFRGNGPALNYLFNFLSENDLEDSEAINVFIVRTTGGGTTGFATLPPSNSNNGRGFVFLKALIGPVVKAHELGHYFGLSHTHRGKDIIDSGGNYGPWVKIRNDYTWNPYYHISAQCNPCGSEVDDRLDDTAPDTYPLCRTNENPCEIIDAPNSNVPGDQGGRLYTFEPPTTNIMSYGLDDRVVFSDKQVALMLTNLAEHPNRLYLIDENMPNCQNLNLETDMFYSETSKVVGGKRNANEELVFAPLENMFIKITKRLDNPIGTFQGECEVYTNYDGQVDLNSDGCLSEDLIRQDDKKFEIGQCLDASACIQLSATEGVSTFDIIQIRKHILGIRDFSTDVEFYPYNSIAADVSNNGIISGLDIIQLQKVILGIYTEFPNTPSWRTLPQYAFTDQFETFRNAFYVNPFNAVWEYDGQSRGYLSNGNALSYVDDPITLYGSNPDTHFEETWSFKAIKTGDVNFSNQVPNELDSHDYDIKLVTNEGTTYGDIRDWLFVPGQVNDGKLDCIDKNQSFTIEVVA